jgi:small-conductance mechanosensitive channel
MHAQDVDTVTADVTQPAAVDSIQLSEMKQALEDARINEMNLRMEMEELRMTTVLSDSIKKAEQKHRIDSLRETNKGTPVVVEGDTLYTIYARQGGLQPQARATNVSKAILELGKRLSFEPDSISIESADIRTDLMYGDKVIASFTDQDGLWMNTSRDELAKEKRTVVVEKLKELQKEYGLMQLIKRILSFLLILGVQILLVWATLRLYRRVKARIEKLKDSKLKPVSFHDYEFLDTGKQVSVLVYLASLGRYVLILVQLLVSIPMLFAIFPQTQDLAYTLFSYVWTPVKSIAKDVVSYIPNLFTIIIIWLSIKYLVKGVGYLAKELETGRLKINGFFPDWAQPSYQIIRFLLYAFMIALIFPYLPKSDTNIFQGVSVFVGLIFSLGSSSVIGNVIAGIVITYMRPFRIGDRIKLNDTVGNVIEKTPFVTRIRTPKNEIVTIPNSFVMSSHTINYSASAKDYGLIIYSEVTFGYEIYWETAYKLLIDAALRTEGVMAKPAPFVLQTSLGDFYPAYQINAYIRDADKINRIYSDLHRNIQNVCNEAGVELTSPHYISTRDGSPINIPEEYRQTGKEKTNNPVN